MSNSSANSLPDYLKDSITASVDVFSLDFDTAPDIAVCSKNGYFFEIKGKKIVNSLNLNPEVGATMQCFYFYANEKPSIIYAVVMKSKKLFLIRRLGSRVELYKHFNIHLKIIKTYECLNKYEIGDFFSFGHPQLKIYKDSENFLCFTAFYGDEVVDQSDFQPESNSITKLLEEKLQIVCRHVDELTEEWHGMKRHVQLKSCQENFSLIPANAVEFPLPLEEYGEKITITSTWMRMISDRLILGIEIFYDGEKPIPSLEFKIHGKLISEYSYMFFPGNDTKLNFKENPLFSCKKTNPSILPQQKITVVGAVLISFDKSLFENELQISCYLTSAEVKNYLIRKTFEVNVSDLLVLNKNYFPENNKCTVEDLQAIKAVKSETRFKIKIKNYVSKTLKDILVDDLGFEEIQYEEDKLYYCRLKYLREAFLAFQPFAATEQVWKFNFYTSNEAQIYFFVNALHELLSEHAIIIFDED